MNPPVFEEDALKPLWRWRQEETLLMVARVVLLASIVVAATLVLVAVGHLPGVLDYLEGQEVGLARALQIGMTLFLGIELTYYFYLSWSFRRWREWGVGLWALAVVVFLAMIFNPID